MLTPTSSERFNQNASSNFSKSGIGDSYQRELLGRISIPFLSKYLRVIFLKKPSISKLFYLLTNYCSKYDAPAGDIVIEISIVLVIVGFVVYMNHARQIALNDIANHALSSRFRMVALEK
jgi:hypothetical protein